MHDSLEVTAASFREAITSAVVPLQTSRVLKTEEFVRLEKIAGELVRLLKGQELVSKSLLNEFFTTVQVLRNEAPHSTNQDEIEGIAKRLEYGLAMILKDESPEQRQPGVPRVI